MKTLSDAEYIESVIRSNLNKHNKVQIEEPNYFIIREIEKLVNSFPLLKKLNYKNMTIAQLQEALTTLLDYLEIYYSESDETFIYELDEKQPFFKFKDILLLIIVMSLTKKAHLQLTVPQQTLNETIMNNTGFIDLICENSYTIKDTKSGKFHFLISAVSIFSSNKNFTEKLDNFMYQLKFRNEKKLTLSEYIEAKKTGECINSNNKLKQISGKIKFKL